MNKNRLLRFLDILGCVAALALISCGPPPGAIPVNPPTLGSAFSLSVKSTRATVGADVTDADGDTISEHGVVYSPTSINAEPSLEGVGVKKSIVAGGDLGQFEIPITGLAPNTEYSFVGYAINSGGVGYTAVSTFTTTSSAGATEGDFSPAVSGNNPFVQLSATLPDGKILIAGDFETVGGHFHSRIARLFPDGSIDTNFVAQVTGSGVASLAVQPDGKILIGGVFTKVNGTARKNLARLNADGTLDTTFSIGAGPDDGVFTIAVQRDGKVLIGGQFENVDKKPRNHLARLGPFGAVEDTATFSTNADQGVSCVAVQDDNQILIVGDFENVNSTPSSHIARLNPNGSIESTATFNPGSGTDLPIYSVVPQEDGQILISGGFTTVNGTARNGIARLNPNGSMESSSTFNPGTGPGGGVPFIFSITTQTDGKILVGGRFTSFDGKPRANVARLNSDGSVEDVASFDIGFGPLGTNTDAYSVGLQANGSIIIGGPFFAFNNESHPFVVLLGNDEATQSLYAPDSTQVQWIRTGSAPGLSGVTFEHSSDGGISWFKLGNGTRITDGWELTGLNLPSFGLLRARAKTTSGFGNGSSGIIEQISPVAGGPAIVTAPTSANETDTTADLGGNVTTDGGSPVSERGVVFSPTIDNSNPSLDDSDTRIEPDIAGGTGVFVVNVTGLELGTQYSFRAYATNDQGTSYSPVATFTTLGPPIVNSPTVTNVTDTTADLGGTVDSDGGVGITERGVVYYSGADTSLDRLASDDAVQRETASGTTGPFTVSVTGLTTGADYTFAAYATNALGTTYSEPLTFTASSSFAGLGQSAGGGVNTSLLAAALDPNFAPKLSGTYVQATALQPDGKTVIGGIFQSVAGASHLNLARLNADGTVDASFNASTNGPVFAVVVQDDGKILVGGSFNVVNGASRVGFARLNRDGSLDSGDSFTTGAGTDGVVYSLALQGDGKIVVGGLFTTVNSQLRKNLARLNVDGSLEGLASFDPGTGPDDAVYSVAVQSDNQILIAGAFQAVDGTARKRIARLDADGSLEDAMTFNPGTGADDRIFALTVQPDGKILVGGSFSTFNGQSLGSFARLNADGSVESNGTFDPGTGADGDVTTIALQADGKILIGGKFANVNGTSRNRVARLTSSGSLDSGGNFDPGTGANGEVDAIAVQTNGQVLLGGGFSTVNGATLQLIARINNDVATQTVAIANGGDLGWLRSGAAPEVSQVRFDFSTDGGVTWAQLGAGSRISNGWILVGQTLPTRGILRARGRTAGGYLGSSSGVVEQRLAFPTTVPVKNGPVTNGSGATFASISTPQTGVFAGVAQAGKIKTAAIFATDGRILLQAGANIAKLGAPNGDAVLVTLKNGGAVTAKNNVQLMVGLNSGNPVVGAQIGTSYPGLPTGVTIKKFLQIDGQGSTTFVLAEMQGTGITPTNKLALCAVTGAGAVKIVASKGQSVTIGASTQAVSTLGTFVASKGTLAANRWRVDDTHFGIRVTFPDKQKQQAIFAVPSTASSSADWTLLTKSGPVGNITGLTGNTVASFGLPGFGDTSVAQVVNLTKGLGDATAKNNVGLIAGNPTNGFRLLARKDFDAPDATGRIMVGVYYSAISDPVGGAGGATAFTGVLAGTGVTPKNKSGIWFAANGVNSKLLARTGDLAPGGGRWSEFTSLALPTDAARGPIFLGKLTPSAVDLVTAKNNVRLWAVDSTGGLQLIFRTGQDAIANGATKQVKSFIALAPAATSLGAASSYDNHGNIAILATFTDGAQALLVVTVP
jgi:uncharacterized delta-60 repeat protein